MGVTYKGLEVIAKAICEESYTGFGNSNAYLGVGDSNTAFSASQTDLQGTNKVRKAMETGYPTRTTRVITWRAYFLGDDGNWHWQEVACFNAASGGDMLCREVQDLGTKSVGTIWVLTLEETVDVCP